MRMISQPTSLGLPCRFRTYAGTVDKAPVPAENWAKTRRIDPPALGFEAVSSGNRRRVGASHQGDPSFRVEVDASREGLLVASLVGELDIASAADLETFVQRTAAQGLHVVVDLTRLTFVDSSGLNALVNAARTVESRDGWVVFAGAPAGVRRVFEIVQLEDTLQIEGSVEAARRRAEEALTSHG